MAFSDPWLFSTPLLVLHRNMQSVTWKNDLQGHFFFLSDKGPSVMQPICEEIVYLMDASYPMDPMDIKLTAHLLFVDI